MAKKTHAKENRIHEHLGTPTDLKPAATRDISAGLTALLADVFALYIKTKNFHWHMSGPHFRDYHLMLDEQSDQIFAMTDVLAERARKIGQLTLHSIGEISRNQRILDNDAPFVTPQDMLAELREDNGELVGRLADLHERIGTVETRVGKVRVLECIANPVLTGFTLPKLLWVRDNEPRAFERLRHMLLRPVLGLVVLGRSVRGVRERVRHHHPDVSSRYRRVRDGVSRVRSDRRVRDTCRGTSRRASGTCSTR